ncbi:ribosomal-protein-alanine N-acetyltransferase [Deltaproteobacteria bacterium Smac51]|nr:ribosomal-protein-alanine N-acetyltransferase [Deltaproteobacteria bacterium Smac51]
MTSGDDAIKGKSPYTLVRLKESDLLAVMALEQACFVQPWTRDNFLGELRRKVTVAMGLRYDGMLVAQCFFWLISPEIHLLNVAVAPRFRGLGLARRLLTVMFSIGRKAGVKTVFLEARPSNLSAIGLYKSLGFEVAGVRPDYYEDGEDAVLMTLEMGPPEPAAGYGF